MHAAPATGAAPVPLASFDEFARTWGGDADLMFRAGPTPHYLAHAVRAYFAEGGSRLYVLPVAAARGNEGIPDAPAASDYAQALAVATLPDEVGVIAAPGASAWCADAAGVCRVLVEEAERAGARRFAVLDAPPGADPDAACALAAGIHSSRGALYYPWVQAAAEGPGVGRLLPPSGFVCAVYARTDRERGVHKAPANALLASAVGLEREVASTLGDRLNAQGVNCLRQFPGRGVRVWGARTLSPDPEWKYVPVRRFVDQLETSIEHGLRWVAFERNGPELWARVRAAVEQFLVARWREGALQGNKAEQAMFVRCDTSTMTGADIEGGRLVCEVGVALVRPAEFLIFRCACRTA
ncbi:phage tail sheath family protein [Luteimonas sp. SDU82]|uniref:phage tail sheath family protein n=1 Tax=Luteimonas sp. SDU82 TaxID=3422592 RepID=UPI003EB71D27